MQLTTGGKRDEHGAGAHRWAVVLAGGDGNRLLPLTRGIWGDDRPKQFCRFIGARTLVDQARSRASMVVPPGHTLTLVTASHQRYYARELQTADASSWLIQPCNRGTTLAIAYALMRVHQMDPHGMAAFLPSDHYVADDRKFVSFLDDAFHAACGHWWHPVLLGIDDADTAEAPCGWIETGSRLDPCHQVYRIGQFWANPPRAVASAPKDRGCLRNSFVMVGRVTLLLRLMQRLLPSLIESLQQVRQASGEHVEQEMLAQLYANSECSSFSDEVLAKVPRSFAVLRCSGLEWIELDEPDQVVALLKRQPISPERHVNGQPLDGFRLCRHTGTKEHGCSEANRQAGPRRRLF